MTKKTQEEQILKILENGDTLTPMSAFTQGLGIRLAARIFDLRQKGHSIETLRDNTLGVARYRMVR
jgi:hypothetical protein|tara:strand:- start:472 stop:669 length:198 start_codon:yes stop_codon:yes gene_type:complete